MTEPHSNNSLSPFAQTGIQFNRAEFLAQVARLTSYKEYALSVFEKSLPDGAIILDAGVGSGIDLPHLANIVGNRGRVIGIDTNPELLALAQNISAEQHLENVSLYKTDIHHLPFPDETFDGVRIDRVLQHVEYPQRALEEAHRVLKPDGMLVVSEPDWELLEIAHPNPTLTAKIITFKREQNIRNGHIAQATTTLLKGIGFENVTATTVNDRLTTAEDIKTFLYLDKLLSDMLIQDVITQNEVEEWIAQLQEASASAKLSCSYTTTILSAQK